MHSPSSPKRSRRLAAGLLIALAFLPWLFVVGFAIGMAAQCAHEVVLGRASLGWQAASGRIGDTRLHERSGRGGKTYTPVIGYRYQAGGRTWTSYRVEATTGYSPVQAKKIMERFPPGAAVTVYHDGQGKSVLIRGVRANSWFGLVVWLLCSCGVLAVTWYEARRFIARRRSAGA